MPVGARDSVAIAGFAAKCSAPQVVERAESRPHPQRRLIEREIEFAAQSLTMCGSALRNDDFTTQSSIAAAATFPRLKTAEPIDPSTGNSDTRRNSRATSAAFLTKSSSAGRSGHFARHGVVIDERTVSR